MANYLITGGCGFIGSHLADSLLTAGHRVRVLDNLSTGKRENLSHRCELHIGDVADPDAVREAMGGMDGCFHLAAVASVELSNRDWAGTHRSNLTGTIHVLDAARLENTHKPCPVVYASSAAIYGDNADVPLKEDAHGRPLTAYGADKMGSELHARVATIVHGVPTTGLRFFNVYGPRQDPSSPYSGVISIFAERVRAGQNITIFGDGEQVRDFIYVSDVVCFLIAAMRRPRSHPAVYNVCTQRPTSIRELASAIFAVSGIYVDIDFMPGRQGDIRTSIGDPTLAAHNLGIRASTDLGVGLRKTLFHHDAHRLPVSRREAPPGAAMQFNIP